MSGCSGDQWNQFFEQAIDGETAACGGFSDSVTVTTNMIMSDNINISSPSSSFTASGQSTSKGNASKPIRRRSRASRRTPATILNANTTNFRALVQQLTGCPTKAPISLGRQRGPINLSFGVGSQQNHGAFVHNYHHQQYSQPQPQPQQLQQQHQRSLHQQLYQVQDQQPVNSFNNVTSDVFVSASSRPNMGIPVPEGLVMDDNSFHELAQDLFSDRNMTATGYFLSGIDEGI